MKKTAGISIIIFTFLILTCSYTLAFTLEFSKDKPGVQDFVAQNLRFTENVDNIINKLPSRFYVISYSADDIPVVAAKIGKIDKAPGLAPYLDKLSGGKTAKSVSGPHNEKIIYNPGSLPDKKLLSSYAVWDGWIFIGNRKETILNVLKQFKSTSDISKTDKAASAIKGWSGAGIKLWANNSDQHLTKLLETQKKSIMIPVFRNPNKITYMAGAFTLTKSKEMTCSLMVKPVNEQADKDVAGDFRFIGETIRRKLTAIKTKYDGKVYSSDKGIFYEAYLGNYQSAQGQIVQGEK